MNVLPVLLKDGYKADHRPQYPDNTQYIYSNLTPRSSRVSYANSVVVFGMQYFIKEFLVGQFNELFFWQPRQKVMNKYKKRLDGYLGPDAVDINHIGELHELGYLPLHIKSLGEGTLCPIGVPSMTTVNTLPEFFWLTNQLETLLSTELWPLYTSATTAYAFRKNFDATAESTGIDPTFVKYMGHDFSMRGMFGHHAAMMSGAAHLTSFAGTDTIPAIDWIEEYYGDGLPEGYQIGSSIPATEHSVMCAGGMEDELGTYRRLINKVYPKGPLAIVSDTWDFWGIMTDGVRALKDDILARDGKVVFRPDCYDVETQIMTENGWKYFKDLNASDLVAQVADDHTVTYVKPTQIVIQDYTGSMVQFKDEKRKVDLLVTPNHRMVWGRVGKPDQIKTALDIVVGNWGRFFYRSAANKNLGQSLDWLDRLRIAFQADGAYESNTNEATVVGQITGEVCIRFNFKKQRKIDRLLWICESGGFKHSVSVEPSRPNFTTIYVWLIVDDKPSKNFNWVPKQGELCGNWCKEFIEELSNWDACIRDSGRIKFDTVNYELITGVERIALAAGYGCLLSKYVDTRNEKFSDVHTANILTSNTIGSQSMSLSVTQYSGKVYCVKVPTGKILVKRNAATAVCGNSGDPVDVICGDINAPVDTPEHKGAMQCLWEVFGGTTNAQGYRQLNPKIGLIYGDSINIDRQQRIASRLKTMGFVPDVVLGNGSYMYQYVTRDTFGFAIKATNAVVNGQSRAIFKSPKGDSSKKSAKGLLRVDYDPLTQKLVLTDQCTPLEEHGGMLKTVFLDGLFMDRYSVNIRDIRYELHGDNF